MKYYESYLKTYILKGKIVEKAKPLSLRRLELPDVVWNEHSGTIKGPQSSFTRQKLKWLRK